MFFIRRRFARDGRSGVFYVNKCKYRGIYLRKVLKRFKAEKKVAEIFATLIF